jgi:hypothetical protein
MQHESVILLFTLVCLSALLEQHANKCLYVPKQLKFALLSLCFFSEALIFYSHLMGKSDQIDYYYHWLNVIAICLIAVVSFVEFLNLESQQSGLSFTLALLRAYFLLVQSTWFIQIGLFLFVFKSSDNNNNMHDQIHGRLMNLTSGFAMHLFTNVCVLLLVSWLGQMRAQRKLKSNEMFSSNENDTSSIKLLIEKEDQLSD